jgi:hypothetical protein
MTNGKPGAVGAAVLTEERPDTRTLEVRLMALFGLFGGTLTAVAPGSTYGWPTVTLVIKPLTPLAVTKPTVG